MDLPRLQHYELERNLDLVEVKLGGGSKVDCVLDGLGEADPDVERVHDGLAEVLLQCRLPQTPEVNPMEVMLLPEETTNQD